MASIIDRIKNDLLEAINASQRKTSAYDTEAEVVRIEGNTAWVHIGGGVTETPVQLTINAQKGDKVQVRVSNEGAWITGNATAPPTDDTKAEEAKQEIIDTNIIVKAVKTMAEQAQKIAGNTNQYFWHTQEGTDTGAHITEIPQEEFLADPSNGGGNLLARSNGIAARDGLTELATFGATGETIGITDGTQSYMSLDYHSIQGIDKEGNTYFYVSDLRDANGEYSAKDTFIGDGVTTVFSLSINVFSNLVVKVNNVEQTINVDYTYDSASWKITFISPPANGSIIDITYTSQNSNSKAYTLGRRAAGSTIGGMSLAEGRLTTASGYASHAEGRETVSSGRFSHAEGIQSTAQNQSSHAEGAETIASGISAHAEGNVTTASGQSAHAEGLRTVASGDESHAQNWRTKASSFAQTAIGQCNIEDTTNTYALIIGNGTADNARSDALRVLWDGNVYMALNTNAGSGIDHDLYAAITALGWQNNVIV